MKKPYTITTSSTAIVITLIGKSLAEVFSLAGQALFESLDARKRKPLSKKGPSRIVRLTGLDEESLLADWLNELIYLHHTYHENYFSFDITRIDTNSLEAVAHGIAGAGLTCDAKHVNQQSISITEKHNRFSAHVEILV